MSKDCAASLRSAALKGTPAFRVRIDRGELIPIHLQALIVPDLGACVFSVGALYEKEMKLDLLSNPPVPRDGNGAFPVSTEIPQMFVLHVLLDGQKESQYASRTAVDTDTWHRKMSPCRPCALKQTAEEPTARVEYIDRTGAAAPSEVEAI